MEYLYMSQEGYDELKEKLAYLKNVRRKEISNDIAVARDKGDLSENAEYHAAKEEQALLESKIVEMEDSFARARVLKRDDVDTSKALILSKVTIKNLKTKREVTYQLVSQAEADAKAKKISIASPIGKGLLGTSVGDVVKIKVPAGILQLEILDISF